MTSFYLATVRLHCESKAPSLAPPECIGSGMKGATVAGSSGKVIAGRVRLKPKAWMVGESNRPSGGVEGILQQLESSVASCGAVVACLGLWMERVRCCRCFSSGFWDSQKRCLWLLLPSRWRRTSTLLSRLVGGGGPGSTLAFRRQDVANGTGRREMFFPGLRKQTS